MLDWLLLEVALLLGSLLSEETPSDVHAVKAINPNVMINRLIFFIQTPFDK
jgi:hypothetical protein